jgi:hypothetical protein
MNVSTTRYRCRNKGTQLMSHFPPRTMAALLFLGLFGDSAMAASNGIVHPAVPATKGLSISRMTQGECLNQLLGKIVKNLACDGEQACSYIGDDLKLHLKCVDSLHLPK